MSLSIAIIGDPNIGKTELFRYLAESCTAKQCLTQSVSVKEFKANVEYPHNQNVIHFFRSANDDKQLQVRSNHTRKYWPTVAPTFETFNIADRPTMVWDLSGNLEFCRLAYAYESFRKVDGFVLCYDMTSKQSFDNLTKWHQQFVLARQDALRAVAKRQHAASSHADTKEHRDVYLASSNVPFVVVGTKADHEEGRKVAHGTVAEFCDISPGTRFFETSARVPGEGRF